MCCPVRNQSDRKKTEKGVNKGRKEERNLKTW
jgi:hypothetical protein